MASASSAFACAFGRSVSLSAKREKVCQETHSAFFGDGRLVVRLVPLSERSGIDLDHGGAGEGVGADEFVVGGVVDDTDHTGLLGDALRTP